MLCGVCTNEPASVFDPRNYPRFFVWSGRDCVAYRTSSRAVSCYGHARIIAAIQVVTAHETGTIRDYNVDAVPVDGQSEQLLIVRSVSSGEIVALTESEYRGDLGWPMP